MYLIYLCDILMYQQIMIHNIKLQMNIMMQLLEAIIYKKNILLDKTITNSKLNITCPSWENYQENKHVQNANIQQQTSLSTKELIFDDICITKHPMLDLKIKLHKHKQLIILMYKISLYLKFYCSNYYINKYKTHNRHIHLIAYSYLMYFK